MKESLSELDQLVKDLPRSAGAHYYLARALESRGRHDEAVGQLRQAAEIAPDHPVIAPTFRQVEAGAVGVAAYPDL